MEIDFNPDKRAWTLTERGLAFADVAQMFEGVMPTLENGRLVMVA